MDKADSAAVLIVDDEPEICRLVADVLSDCGCACDTCTNPRQAMALLCERRYSVLVTDILMPKVTGLDLLVHVRRRARDCKVILLTGRSCRETLAQALVLGAFDYLEKPFRPDELIECVQRAIRAADDPMLPLKAAAAMELRAESVQACFDSVRALVRAVEAKDPYTRSHSEHVARYAVGMAQGLGLSSSEIDSVRVASLLHDVGKIGVPDRVLTKPGPLTNEEFEVIRRHPEIGSDILADITLFGDEANVVRHHHERWDGLGYPDGLAGRTIPLHSRIITVADSVDAILMARSYKAGRPLPRALEELQRCAGTQFDPDVVAVAQTWFRDNAGTLSVGYSVPETAAL